MVDKDSGLSAVNAKPTDPTEAPGFRKTWILAGLGAGGAVALVALLALGTTSENLGEAGDVTAMEATSFLTGQIQDELEYQMNRVLGFDQFHINPSYSETLQTTVPRVTVGRALSDSPRR